jgi:hypothetical protein
MNRSAEIQQDFGDLVKHEARLKLWLPPLKKLKGNLGRYLKYFTLPGPKAYDVIKWRKAGLIEFDGRGFPDVCFCDMDDNNFANAKRVLGNTRGIKAKFEDIILNPRDPKYKAFWDFFPYDVYNLDFCGTWFEDEEPLSETFRSIIELVNTHIRKRGDKFLLFLTIRIDRNKTNTIVINDLKSNLESNRGNPELLPKINIICGNDTDRFIIDYFHKFMLISIPKLIAFKIIPQTKKLSGKIEKMMRAYYCRGRYYIGKFVFFIRKERTTLKINPDWYKQFVSKCFNSESILKIYRDRISIKTKDDLKNLKETIKKLENYGEG